MYALYANGIYIWNIYCTLLRFFSLFLFLFFSFSVGFGFFVIIDILIVTSEDGDLNPKCLRWRHQKVSNN